MTNYILSIDQGTTSSRALLVSDSGKVVFTAQQEFRQIFPHEGWVEHDAEEIWKTTLDVSRQAVAHAREKGGTVLGIGITNQRETTIVWDRETGEPIYNAIVWQDRRTAHECAVFKEQGFEQSVTQKTGLLLDPYFSGTKLRWILQNVEKAEALADQGRLAFGTVDSFLIWRLTAGLRHMTDATNASRTLMFNIHTQQWDDDLLNMLSVPASCLPTVADSADDYGLTDAKWFDQEIPICGVAGDQQAALFGQCCFSPGMIKSTYGTGCFMMMNTGDHALESSSRLLTTVASRLNGEVTYALEGSIFIAGAAIQWLRDEITLLDDAAKSEGMASSLDHNNSVYMVPAFTGLGAPHWDPSARGAIFGLTRDTGKPQLVRSALESIGYQTHDVFSAMKEDGGQLARLRIDGGMSTNSWFCQFLANLLDTPIDRPSTTEATALGAAYLAGLRLGVFESTEQLEQNWQLDRSFAVDMERSEREKLLANWERAVRAVTLFSSG
ncbi:MAG: glycerol kinase GlpK [Pseudomonadota bacterium]